MPRRRMRSAFLRGKKYSFRPSQIKYPYPRKSQISNVSHFGNVFQNKENDDISLTRSEETITDSSIIKVEKFLKVQRKDQEVERKTKKRGNKNKQKVNMNVKTKEKIINHENLKDFPIYPTYSLKKSENSLKPNSIKIIVNNRRLFHSINSNKSIPHDSQKNYPKNCKKPNKNSKSTSRSQNNKSSHPSFLSEQRMKRRRYPVKPNDEKFEKDMSNECSYATVFYSGKQTTGRFQIARRIGEPKSKIFFYRKRFNFQLKDGDIAFVRVTKSLIRRPSPILTTKQNIYRLVGKVLFKYDPNNPVDIVGKIDFRRNKNSPVSILIPRDPRKPRVLISKKDPMLNLSKNIPYSVTITSWKSNQKNPIGKITYAFEDKNYINNETEQIMFNNQLKQSVFQSKRDIFSYQLKSKDEERRDFTSDCVFTIDPDGARDLDDAVSIRKLDDGRMEIGVHIADVTHYVENGSPIDERARKLTSTVYVVHRAYHMLPSVLCSDLCSLNPNVIKKTVSVVWIVDQDMNVSTPWMGLSLIKSCARLTYDQALHFLEHGSPTDGSVVVYGNHTLEEVEKSIKDLWKYAKHLRDMRFKNGSLGLNSPKFRFKINPETFDPYEVYGEKHSISHELIEELMISANQAAAYLTFLKFPEKAILRNHDRPDLRDMKKLISYLSKYEIKLDGSSSYKLNASLEEIERCYPRHVLLAISYYLRKPLTRAKYICSGSEKVADKEILPKFHHYGLSLPLYTHFTSPIRRYPDILVHRLLRNCFSAKDEFKDTTTEIQTSLDLCNLRAISIDRTDNESLNFNFWILLQKKPMKCKGVILEDIYSRKSPFVLLTDYMVVASLNEDSVTPDQILTPVEVLVEPCEFEGNNYTFKATILNEDI